MAAQETARPDQIHLCWGEDATSTAVVNWQTPHPVAGPTLEYRQAGTQAWQQAPAESFPSPGRGMLHRAVLGGLTPGATIEYRIAPGPDAAETDAAPYRFRMAQPGPFDYHFAFFCDTGLIGRLDGLATGTAQIRAAIGAAEPLFLLGGGDYAYGNRDGRYEVMAEAADEWFRQWQPVLPYVPFYPQYGNHEILLVERFEDWGPRFAVPNPQADGRYYSFDVGDVHFTALFVPDYKILPDQAQLAWLDRDLETARRQGARWRVVFLHSAIYGCGVSHPSKPELTNLLVPYFDKHKVDLVLSGHDQSYERTFPLLHPNGEPVVAQSSLDSYTQGNGVIYAKVSPSGKQSEISKNFSTFTAEQQPFMARRDDTAHHYAVIRVQAAGTLGVEVYSVHLDGSPQSLFDRFTITASASS